MILEFPAPARSPSVNQVHGAHWTKYYSDKQAWQMAGKVAFAQAKHPNGIVATPDNAFYLAPCWVQVTIPFTQNRRRDPHNYVGTVVKWIIDGLVYAGAWPDDTPEWVEVLEPVLVKDPNLMVRVEIEPR